MLPPAHRMTNRVEFSTVVRAGRRAKTATLVLHHHTPSATAGPTTAEPAPARVGFVVSKAVGNSVVRHRVARRLRARLADRLPVLPAGSGTVVRALPAAATATSAQLDTDVATALERLGRGRRT